MHVSLIVKICSSIALILGLKSHLAIAPDAVCRSRFPRDSYRVYGWSVHGVFVLLASLGCNSALANSPPFFTQIQNAEVRVGESFNIVVAPQDPDQTVPGLLINNAPQGSEFVDNRDGTRTFRWSPSAPDVGEHRVLFITVDALDQSLRFSQEVFLTVLPGLTSVPTEVIAEPDVIPASPPVTTTLADDDPGSLPAEESTELSIVEELSNPDPPVAQVLDGNHLPVMEISGGTTVTAGERFELRIIATDVDGAVPSLVAHALPAGATFPDNGDGSRSIVWTPPNWLTGTFDIVVVATDANRNDHRVQETVRLSVVAPGEPGADVAELVPVETPTELLSVTTPEAPTEPPANTAEPTTVENTVTEEPAQPVIAESPATDVVVNDERIEDLPGNQAPYFAGMTNQVVSIGDTLRFVVAPIDPDGDVPGMYADRLPYNSSFRDNFNGTRTLIWRPYPADKGDFWITFTAVDAVDPTLKTHRSMKITVEDNGGYNFEPVINGINNPVVRAGDTLRQLVQPVDPDGDVPKLYVLNPPAGADFVDNQDGTRTLVWTTAPEHITELGDIDTPHLVDFLAIDSRDDNLRDDHQLKISVVDRNSRERSGERLRVLAERRDFLIGFAAMLKSSSLADTDIYLDIASQEFNIVTPENSHKWGWIQPDRGEFNFIDADAIADYAVEHGMVLHGHPLLWHRQLPGWVQNMELSEAEQIMNEHIDALVSRYRGKVGVWDVVNEALEEDGTYRDSIWYEAMGEQYIAKAFHRARQQDPDAVLMYNDYDVGWPGPKADGMYNLLKRELAAGTPIDAVGFQMHVWTAFDGFDLVRANFQRFADLGLDIYITEFDVAFTAQWQEQLQASVYEQVARICLEQPRCKALQAWGFTDRYSWRYNHKPLLFTERYHAKPAYYAWQRALSW